MLEMYARTITTLHVELTAKCHLSCPQCPRSFEGEPNKALVENELTYEQFRELVTPTMLRGLDHIYFCGNFGDPAMAKDLLKVLRYIREIRPTLLIGMHTNGSLRNKVWWTELAIILKDYHYVVFSIDGLEDTNKIYRIGSVWARIMENANSFISAGGQAQWHYLIFDHNKHQVEEAKQLAEELGFTKFQSKQTLRILPKKIQWLKPGDKEHYDNQMEKAETASVLCQAQREKSIYLSATGVFYPCCYTANQNFMGGMARKDFDYENIRFVNRLPRNPDSDICRDKCKTIDNRNVTERQYLDATDFKVG